MRFILHVWFALTLTAPLHAQTEYFVAPTASGNGSGSSPANAAVYTNSTFWGGVRTGVNSNPVTVTFLDGQYASGNLILSEIGHADYRLVLQSQTEGGAVFAGAARVQLRGSQNITIRHFGFTGNDPNANIYKLQVTATSGDATGIPSRNVLVEGNRFYDMPVYYAAAGVSNGSHHVTFHDNTFGNVGSTTHAHMLYNANDAHHIKVIGNHFEDSWGILGDYVRFRNNVDFAEVRLNTFISNSPDYNYRFVEMPIYNDVNPGDETHASNYLVRDNSFHFTSTATGRDDRNVMGYRSSGFEPIGYNYLPSAADGNILEHGTPAQKRQLLLDTMSIDLTKVRVYGNTYSGENYIFRFAAFASFGAPSQGWTGVVDITDAINSTYLGAGDVYSDALLDEQDVALFLLAVDAVDELSFLLDNRVWFGDYGAADFNGDGIVDARDAQPFIDLFAGRVSEEALAPVRALVPEPSALGLLVSGVVLAALRRRAARAPVEG